MQIPRRRGGPDTATLKKDRMAFSVRSIGTLAEIAQARIAPHKSRCINHSSSSLSDLTGQESFGIELVGGFKIELQQPVI